MSALLFLRTFLIGFALFIAHQWIYGIGSPRLVYVIGGTAYFWIGYLLSSRSRQTDLYAFLSATICGHSIALWLKCGIFDLHLIVDTLTLYSTLGLGYLTGKHLGLQKGVAFFLLGLVPLFLLLYFWWLPKQAFQQELQPLEQPLPKAFYESIAPESKGKRLIAGFFYQQYEACQQGFRELQELHSAYMDEGGVQILAIHYGSSDPQVIREAERALRQKGFSFPVAVDSTGLFHKTGLKTDCRNFLLVRADGTVAYRLLGRNPAAADVQWRWVERWLQNERQ